MDYQTIKVDFQEPVCFITFDRPEASNTINDLLIEECTHVMELCERTHTIIVLEGSPEVFCFGADFEGIYSEMADGQQVVHNPEPLYDLWLRLATGPYITISHVRGKANAGGMGFVAASDIVIADQTAKFSLSELLFGLFPACVLPFLIRRVGFQRANYMTLMTQSITGQQACAWGLVDACDSQSQVLLRKHLLRLKHVPKDGILRYKRYMKGLYAALLESEASAVQANREMFSDSRNLARIRRYVEKEKLPWED